MTPRKKVKPSPEFAATFTALRKVLKKYEPELVVFKDRSDNYYLNTSKFHNKRPVMFGAVIITKNYVSLHLMPVYASPELRDSMSDALRKRMQGKACFNFTTIEPAMLRELTALTARAFRGFKKAGWV